MKFSKDNWYWAVIYDIGIDLYSIEKCRIKEKVFITSTEDKYVYLISTEKNDALFCAENKIFENYCDAQDKCSKLRKRSIDLQYSIYCRKQK